MEDTDQGGSPADKGEEMRQSGKWEGEKEEKQSHAAYKSIRQQQFHGLLSWRCRSKTEGADVSRPRRNPEPNPKNNTRRRGCETSSLSTILALLHLLPANVCCSLWNLTTSQKLLRQLQLSPFYHGTQPQMHKASLRVNTKSRFDIALKAWQLNFC